MGQHVHAVVIVDFVACHQSDVVLALLLDVFVPRVRCSVCIVVLFLCRFLHIVVVAVAVAVVFVIVCVSFVIVAVFSFFAAIVVVVDNGDLLHSVAVIGGDVGGASGCCTGGLP